MADIYTSMGRKVTGLVGNVGWVMALDEYGRPTAVYDPDAFLALKGGTYEEYHLEPTTPTAGRVPGVVPPAIQPGPTLYQPFIQERPTPQVTTVERAVKTESGWEYSPETGAFKSPEGQEFSIAAPEVQQRLGEFGFQGVVYDWERKILVPASKDQMLEYQKISALFPEEYYPELPQTVAEYNARLAEERQRLEQAISTVLPGTTLDDFSQLISSMSQSEQVQTEFLQDIQAIGRTPETEFLLRTIFPIATVGDMNLLFGEVLAIEQPTAEEILDVEPQWENALTGEIINESDLRKRFPKGYEAGLDEWRLTVETGRNYWHVFKVFGESLTKLPQQLASSILMALQPTGASVVNKDWADRFISEAQTDLNQFAQDVTQEYSGLRLPIKLSDLATLPQNMAFSLTSMGAGLAVGVPIALIPEPTPASRVAAWAAGTAASGAVAFNITHYQIMQSYLEVKDEEMRAALGRGLTLAEEKQLKSDFSSRAIKYGLWEAVPEALSNLAFAKLLTMPLGKMIGKSIASRVLSKLVGVYGEELLTETITQKGQSDIEVQAGLREKRISWVEAFKEVAPQTFLLTTIMGGLGQISVSSVTKIKNSLRKELVNNPELYDTLKEYITEDVFAEVEAEAAAQEQARVEEVAPTKVPPKTIFPQAGIYKSGDVFTAPEGNVTLRNWAASQGKWVVDMPDGTDQRLTVPELDNLTKSKQWIYQPKEVVKPPVTPEVTIPKAEAGMPEAKPPAVEEVGYTQYQSQGEVEGLREWITTEPAIKLISLIKRTGWYTGEVKNLTKEQYRDITGKEPKASILSTESQTVTRKAHTTKVGKYIPESTYKTTREVVRWEYALDDVATEMGYESGEALKEAIERAGTAQARIKELESKPIPPTPADFPKQTELPTDAITSQELTPTQVDKTLELFSEAITDQGTLKQRAAALELRKHILAQRGHNYPQRVQQLIVDGMGAEEAANTAKQELSGKLPDVTTDYFSDLSQEMRNVLFAANHQYWMDKPDSGFEEVSTVTAITNALLGKSIPDKSGTGTKYFPEGGSARDRLIRVFNKQPAILKMLLQEQPLSTVIEGIFVESGRGALTLDKATVDMLKELATLTEDEKLILEKGIVNLTHDELQRIAENNYFRRKQELDQLLTDGGISSDEYNLELRLAKDKVYPYPKVAPFEAPIEDAFKQLPMLTQKEKHMIVRTLKGIGLNAVDIGNLIRANVASFDLSALRQLSTLAVRNPVEIYRGFIEGWKGAWNQRSAEANQEWVRHQPSYPYYANMVQRTGQDFIRTLVAPKGTAQYQAAEEYGYLTGERPIPSFAAKIPWIKVSGRAFTCWINTTTILIYNKCLEATLRRAEMIASGMIKLKEGESFDIQDDMDGYGKAIAWMTQRASLGKARAMAPEISAIFFAPRSKLGRLLTPKLLIDSNPRVRAFAWQNLMLWVGVTGGLLALGKWLDLWDVETDMRSGEYGSLRIGNLRIDPWAGNRQFLVLYSRLITGTGISSVTGQEYDVDPVGALTSFFRTSLAPLSSIILDFWTGRNFLGEKMDVTNAEQWIKRIAPFSIQDVWEAFQESWQTAAIAVLPAIFGQGVQTYTGDWDKDWNNLGLPKYLENTAYGINEPVNDLVDFWSDHAGEFKGVDPETLTERKGFKPYIKALAEALQIIEQVEVLPNVRFTSINADPEKGLTFVDYHKMWEDRQKIVGSGDEDKLKEFDDREIVIDMEGTKAKQGTVAKLGNMTQRQYAGLLEYHQLSADKQAQFLADNPWLYANPREDYWRTHSDENALVAFWGKAGIYSLDALEGIDALAKELDVPDSAMIVRELDDVTKLKLKNWEYMDLLEVYKGLDNKVKDAEGLTARDRAIAYLNTKNPGAVDDMRRIKALNVGSTGDYQIDLIVHSLEKSRETHMRGIPEEERSNWDTIWVAAYNHIISQLEDVKKGVTDKDKIDIALIHLKRDIELDTKTAQEYREKGNIETAEHYESVVSIFKEAVSILERHLEFGTIVEAWVEQGKVADEFGDSSSEVKVWYLDNPEVYQWAVDNGLTTADKENWNEPILRINTEWAKEFDQYDAYDEEKLPNGQPNPTYIPDDDERAAARDKLIFTTPPNGKAAELSDFGKAYYTKEASSRGYSESNWDAFVEFAALPNWGTWKERFLSGNPEFYKEYLKSHPQIDETVIRPQVRDEVYGKFIDQFRQWKETAGMSKEETQTLHDRLDKVKVNGTTFEQARRRVDAYDDQVPEEHIDTYVKWYTTVPKKEDDTWYSTHPDETFYEEDWFLLEHEDFYRTMVDIGLWKPRDFSKVPSREVFSLYQIYIGLPQGQTRLDYRLQYPDLDEWGVLAKGWTPAAGRTHSGTTNAERWAELVRRSNELLKRAGALR